MPSIDELTALLREQKKRLGIPDHAPNTVRGYAYDWRRFEKWCVSLELTALPAASQTLELYVTARLYERRKTTTCGREISAIIAKHLAGNLPSPASAELWELIDTERRKRMERSRQSVRREKQDQAGRGREIGIPYGRHAVTCPVLALRVWLDLRQAPAGPVFGLSCNEIRLIVKGCARLIGLDPEGYGSHSLRAGFVTAAGEAGAGELLIASQTGHRTMAVLRQYFRHAELFRANPCAALDL